VGEFYASVHLFFGKVAGKGAHAEFPACQVNGVSAVNHGHTQFFQVACG
jgi:hypothetical protein